MNNIQNQVEQAFAQHDADAIADASAAIVEARAQYREMKAAYFALPRNEAGKRHDQMRAIKSLFSKRFIEDFDWEVVRKMSWKLFFEQSIR